jgi:hypothetical protein
MALYVMPGTIDVAWPAAAPDVGTGVTAPSAGTAAVAAMAAGMAISFIFTPPFKPQPVRPHEHAGRT